MEKSKMVRKGMILAGGLAMMVVLPACGVAGIMDPTERSPRPDPAVESGEVENPVEVRDDEGAEEETPEPTPPEEEAPPEAAPSGGASGEFGNMAPRPGLEGPKGKGGKGGEMAFVGDLAPVEDGVRRVGEAGEVEFRVENGVLNLVDVSANGGWNYQLGKQDFDEAKVFFLGEDSQWEFEAEIKEGYLLEVETKQEIPFAEPETYEVGEAGEVSFSAAGGGVALDDYAVADGWSAYIEENDFEDVHLKFFSDESGVEYKFEAEYDDGFVEVNIDRKERGPLATN